VYVQDLLQEVQCWQPDNSLEATIFHHFLPWANNRLGNTFGATGDCCSGGRAFATSPEDSCGGWAAGKVFAERFWHDIWQVISWWNSAGNLHTGKPA